MQPIEPPDCPPGLHPEPPHQLPQRFDRERGHHRPSGRQPIGVASRPLPCGRGHGLRLAPAGHASVDPGAVTKADAARAADTVAPGMRGLRRCIVPPPLWWARRSRPPAAGRHGAVAGQPASRPKSASPSPCAAVGAACGTPAAWPGMTAGDIHGRSRFLRPRPGGPRWRDQDAGTCLHHGMTARLAPSSRPPRPVAAWPAQGGPHRLGGKGLTHDGLSTLGGRTAPVRSVASGGGRSRRAAGHAGARCSAYTGADPHRSPQPAAPKWPLVQRESGLKRRRPQPRCGQFCLHLAQLRRCGVQVVPKLFFLVRRGFLRHGQLLP